MLKTQIDQYDMLLSVENHLNVNAALIATNAPLVATKTLISSKIGNLATQIALQLVNPSGITEQKKTVRDSLESQVFVIGAACCSYASANNYNDLYKKCHYTKSDLVKFRDAEIVGIATNLYIDATANATALVPFGVTPAVLTGLQTSTTAFSNIMKTPTEAIAKRAAATEKIANLLPEILEIVSKRLDNDVVSMTASQPNFVDVYENVRLINSSPTTTLSLTITVLDEVTNTSIPNVDLEIIGQAITRRTSARGYNTVLNLVAGNHTIKAIHPNYTTKTQDFTVVSGETTELIVLLHMV
jgi:hypothetical protein